MELTSTSATISLTWVARVPKLDITNIRPVGKNRNWECWCRACEILANLREFGIVSPNNFWRILSGKVCRYLLVKVGFRCGAPWHSVEDTSEWHLRGLTKTKSLEQCNMSNSPWEREGGAEWEECSGSGSGDGQRQGTEIRWETGRESRCVEICYIHRLKMVLKKLIGKSV